MKQNADKPLENEPEDLDALDEEDDAPPITCSKQLAHETIRRQHRRGNIAASLGGLASLGLLVMGLWSEYRRANPPAPAIQPVKWVGPITEVRYVTNYVGRPLEFHDASENALTGTEYRRAAYLGALVLWKDILEGQTNLSLPGAALEAWEHRADPDFDRFVKEVHERFPGGFNGPPDAMSVRRQ